MRVHGMYDTKGLPEILLSSTVEVFEDQVPLNAYELCDDIL